MIRPEDLRIRNKALLNDSIVRIDGISYDRKAKACLVDCFDEVTSLCSFVSINKLSGIPLTEEILVKAGFEFDIFYQKHTNGTLCIYWVNKVCLVSWCKSHREDILRHQYPEYVHELQNLFYWLTKQELQIEL